MSLAAVLEVPASDARLSDGQPPLDLRDTRVRVLAVDDDTLDFLAVKRLVRQAQGAFAFEAVHIPSLVQGLSALTTESTSR
jgi:hypothetical protein